MEGFAIGAAARAAVAASQAGAAVAPVASR
jgi:hypothetical protein